MSNLWNEQKIVKLTDFRSLPDENETEMIKQKPLGLSLQDKDMQIEPCHDLSEMLQTHTVQIPGP